MKDQNNKPITEEDFTKGESVRVEIPVEKTVEELFEEYVDLSYKIDINPYDSGQNEYRLNRCSQIIQEVKQQVRREVLEDLMIVANKYELEEVIRELEQYSVEKGITLKN